MEARQFPESLRNVIYDPFLKQAGNNNSERNIIDFLVFIAVKFQNVSYIPPNEYQI